MTVSVLLANVNQQGVSLKDLVGSVPAAAVLARVAVAAEKVTQNLDPTEKIHLDIELNFWKLQEELEREKHLVCED